MSMIRCLSVGVAVTAACYSCYLYGVHTTVQVQVPGLTITPLRSAEAHVAQRDHSMQANTGSGKTGSATQSTHEMPEGEWLSDAHEITYGTKFKWAYFGCGPDMFMSVVRRLRRMWADKPRKDLDVYQFGVYTGGGAQCMCKKLAAAGVVYGRYVGFDSFSGLPPEDSKIDPAQMEGAHWKPGAFSAADAIKEYNTTALLNTIKATIGYADTVLIPGMFSDTLTDELAAQMRPAMLVDVDVDLYISARQCLEWMAKHHLMVVGTVLRYDDWKGTAEWKGGESLAHREVSKMYNFKWQRLHFNVFVLSQIG